MSRSNDNHRDPDREWEKVQKCFDERRDPLEDPELRSRLLSDAEFLENVTELRDRLSLIESTPKNPSFDQEPTRRKPSRRKPSSAPLVLMTALAASVVGIGVILTGGFDSSPPARTKPFNPAAAVPTTFEQTAADFQILDFQILDFQIRDVVETATEITEIRIGPKEWSRSSSRRFNQTELQVARTNDTLLVLQETRPTSTRSSPFIQYKERTGEHP